MTQLFSSCENCSGDHDGSFGSGRFCSIKCARAFSTKNKRDEISEKVSQTLKGRDSPLKGRTWKMSSEARSNHRNCMQAWHKSVRHSKPFDELGSKNKRAIIFEEQGGKCAECNSPPLHNNKPLVFQLDHKDGDRTNNSRANLQLLCPNCHTQTETWGSKNARGEAKQRMLSGKKLASLTGFEPATLAFGEPCSSD